MESFMNKFAALRRGNFHTCPLLLLLINTTINISFEDLFLQINPICIMRLKFVLEVL